MHFRAQMAQFSVWGIRHAPNFVVFKAKMYENGRFLVSAVKAVSLKLTQKQTKKKARHRQTSMNATKNDVARFVSMFVRCLQSLLFVVCSSLFLCVFVVLSMLVSVFFVVCSMFVRCVSDAVSMFECFVFRLVFDGFSSFCVCLFIVFFSFPLFSKCFRCVSMLLRSLGLISQVAFKSIWLYFSLFV